MDTKKSKKGGVSEQGTLLAHYFCDNTRRVKVLNKGVSKREYMRQVGIAKGLLEKYTFDELKSVIDYLIHHPPKGGLSSLMYLKYVTDEILKHIEYQNKLKEAKNNNKVNLSNTKDKSNLIKYKQNNKRKLKGIGAF